MAPHSSTPAWKIPWMGEPGRLQSMESLRVGHNWATSLSLLTFVHWRRKWQPTPVFLPGESQGRGSLVGCRLWGSHRVGHDWRDAAAAAAASPATTVIYLLPLLPRTLPASLSSSVVLSHLKFISFIFAWVALPLCPAFTATFFWTHCDLTLPTDTDIPPREAVKVTTSV